MKIGPADPLKVAAHVGAILDSLGISYSIGGSIAGSFAGEPRTTVDIDVVVALEEATVPAFVRAFEYEFYIDEHAVRRAVLDRSSANAIHLPTSIKIDFFVAGGTPLDTELLQRHRPVSVTGDDRNRLWVHSPEDILLQKLRWYRRGGGSSDRQWRDALGIARTQGERLDRSYLHDGATRLQIVDLLQRVLLETE
jgi:hypothetical protein